VFENIPAACSSCSGGLTGLIHNLHMARCLQLAKAFSLFQDLRPVLSLSITEIKPGVSRWEQRTPWPGRSSVSRSVRCNRPCRAESRGGSLTRAERLESSSSWFFLTCSAGFVGTPADYWMEILLQIP